MGFIFRLCPLTAILNEAKTVLYWHNDSAARSFLARTTVHAPAVPARRQQGHRGQDNPAATAHPLLMGSGLLRWSRRLRRGPALRSRLGLDARRTGCRTSLRRRMLLHGSARGWRGANRRTRRISLSWSLRRHGNRRPDQSSHQCQRGPDLGPRDVHLPFLHLSCPLTTRTAGSGLPDARERRGAGSALPPGPGYLPFRLPCIRSTAAYCP
jgi:hypothetical protein